MKQLTQLLEAQKKVLSKKYYLGLFAISTVIFIWLFVFLTTIPGQSFESWNYSVGIPTKTFMIVGSILLGLVFTTQIYVLQTYKLTGEGLKTTGGATGAFLTAIIATACCSPFIAGALAVLGFVGASAFVLKYDYEITALATIILAIALYYSSKTVFCEECRVKTQKAFS